MDSTKAEDLAVIVTPKVSESFEALLKRIGYRVRNLSRENWHYIEACEPYLDALEEDNSIAAQMQREKLKQGHVFSTTDPLFSHIISVSFCPPYESFPLTSFETILVPTPEKVDYGEGRSKVKKGNGKYFQSGFDTIFTEYANSQ